VRTPKGNRHLKRILCQLARIITRMRNTRLCAWYWKARSRRGDKKAIIALAHKLLTIIYTVLKNKVPYQEEYFFEQQKSQQQRRQQAMIKELTRQGYVVLAPEEVTAV
jgi:hypothetical protein